MGLAILSFVGVTEAVGSKSEINLGDSRELASIRGFTVMIILPVQVELSPSAGSSNPTGQKH